MYSGFRIFRKKAYRWKLSMYLPITYPLTAPKKVAKKISGMRKKRFKWAVEASSPAVKSKLSPGRAKKIPDSRKTTAKIPIYPYWVSRYVVLKRLEIIAGDEGIEPSPVLLESAVLPLN